jgi:hypothetical protein
MHRRFLAQVIECIKVSEMAEAADEIIGRFRGDSDFKGGQRVEGPSWIFVERVRVPP